MTSVIVFGMAIAAIALLGLAAFMYFRLAPRRAQQEFMSERLMAGGAAVDTGTPAFGTGRIIEGSGRLAITLNRSLWQAGMRGDGRNFWVALMGGALVAVLIGLLFGWLAGMIAVAVILAGGIVVIRQLQSRYRKKLVAQLPEFLEHVIRALAAGNTLEAAFSAATDESPDPIKSLFASVIRQLKLGAPLDEVLAEAAEVNQVRDLHVVALSAKINRKYGGSLRRLLKVLINAIHQRERTIAELRALTSETRFSALVLVIIPAVLIGFVLFQNPVYYKTAWADTYGRMMLIGTGVLQAAGSLMIYRMLRSTGGEC